MTPVCQDRDDRLQHQPGGSMIRREILVDEQQTHVLFSKMLL